ncbi:MAG: DPP IV N-terminal domain-containing protein [Anaerolineae bacterium]
MMFILRLTPHLLITCTSVILAAATIGQRYLPTSDIAFIANRGIDDQIYILDSERQLEHRLSSFPVLECCLAWSPDGQRLAFVSKPIGAGNANIYVLDFANSQLLQLTTSSRGDWMPNWSPDGQHIAFISYRDGNAELYTMTANGDEQTRISTSAFSEIAPQWSPDGDAITTAALMNDAPNSYLGISAGLFNTSCSTECKTGLQPLLDPALLLTPTESFRTLPNQGLVVAAYSGARAGGYSFYALRRNSNQPPERLVYNADLDPPSITSADHMVAFISGERDATRLVRLRYVYVLDGSCLETEESCIPYLKLIAENVGADNGLSLSTDGQWVVFTAVWSGSVELYRAHTDGSSTERLTWNNTVEMQPAWRP